MNLHFWKQDGYDVAGYLGDSKYLHPIQTLRCGHCGEVIRLPDCGKLTCQALLSLGCSTKLPLKEKWKSPIKKKEYEDVRDYPAKKRRST